HLAALLVVPELAVSGVERDLSDRRLQLLLPAGEVALDGLEPVDQRPGVVEVVVDEAVRGVRRLERRERLEPLVDDTRVPFGPRRRQVGRRAEGAGVGTCDAIAELLEAGDRPEA